MFIRGNARLDTSLDLICPRKRWIKSVSTSYLAFKRMVKCVALKPSSAPSGSPLKCSVDVVSLPQEGYLDHHEVEVGHWLG
jgi:hypothetical protein